MPSCGVCLSVCLSRSWVVSKRINISSEFVHSGSQAILVFSYQTAWQYSDGNPLGVSTAGGVGKKRDSGRISGFAAYRSPVLSTVRYESRSAKNKATTNGGKRRVLTAASVVRCSHTMTTKCLWRVRGYNPVFCCRRTSYRTEPGGYFCWKLTLTRTPDLIRPTRRNPDPNRPTNGSKQGGLWPSGCLSGVFGRTPPETIRDSKTEFNRILCTSKSEAAVTSNKITVL